MVLYDSKHLKLKTTSEKLKLSKHMMLLFCFIYVFCSLLKSSVHYLREVHLLQFLHWSHCINYRSHTSMKYFYLMYVYSRSVHLYFLIVLEEQLRTIAAGSGLLTCQQFIQTVLTFLYWAQLRTLEEVNGKQVKLEACMALPSAAKDS